jgi:hypothetical protein
VYLTLYRSVKVINVISGEVGTNILKRDQSSLRKLPENSFYRPLEAEFHKHINRTPGQLPLAKKRGAQPPKNNH